MRCSCSSARRRLVRASSSVTSAEGRRPTRCRTRGIQLCPGVSRAADRAHQGALSALLFWRILPAIVRGISFRWTMRIGVWSACRRRRTSSSAWWRRRSSCGPIWRVSRGGSSSRSWRAAWRRSPARCFSSTLDPLRATRCRRSSLHPLGASGVVIAFVMVPPGLTASESLKLQSEASGAMDALTRGTLEGAQLLINIVAMLVVFVALVALVNLLIAPYTLQGLLGSLLAPLAWLAGIPWAKPTPPAHCSAADGNQRACRLPGPRRFARPVGTQPPAHDVRAVRRPTSAAWAS